jgi:hypothetical protein
LPFKRQSGVPDVATQPASLVGLQMLQRWLLTQYGRESSVMHSVSLAQPRHTLIGVAVRLQIGAVGVMQSAASFAVQPPQAPLGVHTGLPGQLSGVALHASQVKVVALQMGVVPLQPSLFEGLQAAQLPCMHSVRPSGLPAQSVASRHCAQTALRPFPVQYGRSVPQAAALPQPQMRSLHAFAAVGLQAASQSVQLPSSVVATQAPLQQSRLRAQSAWLLQSPLRAPSSAPSEPSSATTPESVLSVLPSTLVEMSASMPTCTPLSARSLAVAGSLSRSKSVTSEQLTKSTASRAVTAREQNHGVREGRGIASFLKQSSKGGRAADNLRDAYETKTEP